MPSFQYQSLTTSGEVRTGTLDAADQGEVVRLLLGRGETATDIRPADGATAAVTVSASAVPAVPVGDEEGAAANPLGLRILGRGTGRPSLRRHELATFIRELATAIEAGLPLMQSLRTVRRQAHGRAMPVILDFLIERVEAGDPMYSAARDYGPPFDDMVVGMLRAADASGEMSEVLHQLAELLERSVELRREVVGATVYPLIVFLLLIGSVIVLITVVVPRLIEPMYGDVAGFEMPWPTKVVLGIANFVQSYWYLCIGAGIGGWVGWRLWSQVPANRLRIDHLKLRLPIFGRVLRDVAVARFTRTLGTLSTAGLPMIDALRITRNTLGNHALMAAIDEVQDQVTAGKSLAEPLERSKLFPALLVQVVSLGERSGRLDAMLLHAAKAFDRQVNASINILSKLLQPLLLVVMATIGVFVLAAILLPLLNMNSLVQ
jgi:type II secretory pathway component PulF